MKRLLASASVLLFLASCGGTSVTGGASCEERYWDGIVGTCLPDGWVVVDRETLAERGIPDEVIVAYQAQKAVSGQFPTVLVTREPLQEAVDATTYSEASIRSVSTMPGYKLIDTKGATIDGTKLDLHVFSAQPIEDEPARRFYQVSAVSENSGYTFTGLGPVSIAKDLESQILLILQSATFTGPDGEESSSSSAE